MKKVTVKDIVDATINTLKNAVEKIEKDWKIKLNKEILVYARRDMETVVKKVGNIEVDRKETYVIGLLTLQTIKYSLLINLNRAEKTGEKFEELVYKIMIGMVDRMILDTSVFLRQIMEEEKTRQKETTFM